MRKRSIQDAGDDTEDGAVRAANGIKRTRQEGTRQDEKVGVWHTEEEGGGGGVDGTQDAEWEAFQALLQHQQEPAAGDATGFRPIAEDRADIELDDGRDGSDDGAGDGDDDDDDDDMMGEGAGGGVYETWDEDDHKLEHRLEVLAQRQAWLERLRAQDSTRHKMPHTHDAIRIEGAIAEAEAKGEEKEEEAAKEEGDEGSSDDSSEDEGVDDDERGWPNA